MYRFDIINKFIETRFPNNSTYLEIGARNLDECFNIVKAVKKTSVDLGVEIGGIVYDYNMTSDDFFDRLEKSETEFQPDHKWDIIFIDALHLAPQLLKDITNSINHTHENSIIVMHDCCPVQWYHAHSDYDFFINSPNIWNGTCWKTLYFMRTTSNYDVYTIDTDCGCGILDKSKFTEKIQHTNFFFEYGVMSKNRKNDLGLISVDEFLRVKL